MGAQSGQLVKMGLGPFECNRILHRPSQKRKPLPKLFCNKFGVPTGNVAATVGGHAPLVPARIVDHLPSTWSLVAYSVLIVAVAFLRVRMFPIALVLNLVLIGDAALEAQGRLDEFKRNARTLKPVD